MTDDELDRLEKLARRAEEMASLGSHTWVRSDTGTTAEFLRAAPLVSALVAEVRRLESDCNEALQRLLNVGNERDTLRAENERLRGLLSKAMTGGNFTIDEMLQIDALTGDS